MAARGARRTPASNGRCDRRRNRVKALELSPILRALFNILRTTMACGAAITLASCGGPPGSQDSDVGPREGASHPTVGQLAPDFAAENPNGAWLSLVSVKDK